MTRPPLTRDAIVDHALDLIDREGLEALTMRRLGAALGVEGMALYHHFASKQALLDAVVTRVITPAEPPPTGDWRTVLRELGIATRRRLGAHPHLLPILFRGDRERRVTVDLLEQQYQALHRAGLRGTALLDAHRTWGSYVLGYVAFEQQARPTPDWRPPPGSSHPRTAELDGAQGSRDWDEQFEVGLDIVLAGIAAHRPP